MDAEYPDDMRPARALSPAFRSGPRRGRQDANADEIIRFVREFQRRDSTPTVECHGASSLKRKSVLPAIGFPCSQGDDIARTSADCTDNVEFRDVASTSSVLPHPQVTMTSASDNNSVNISAADSGFADKMSDPTDSNSDDNDVSNDNSNDCRYKQPNADALDEEIGSFTERADPFWYKAGVTLTRVRNGSIFDDSESEVKSLDPHSVFVEDQLISLKTRRPSRLGQSVMLTDNTDSPRSSSRNSWRVGAHSNKAPLSSRFSNGASTGGQLFRPRPLPQLPPISRNEIPARPCAPSPSITPPSPRSLSDTDGEDDDKGDDYNEENDIVGYDDNRDVKGNSVVRKTDMSSEKPIDFIDCP